MLKKQGNQILSELLEDLFDIHTAGWPEKFYNANFLSLDIGMVPRDILYLIKEIESQYSVRFRRNNLLEEDFFCFQRMAEYIDSE